MIGAFFADHFNVANRLLHACEFRVIDRDPIIRYDPRVIRTEAASTANTNNSLCHRDHALPACHRHRLHLIKHQLGTASAFAAYQRTGSRRVMRARCSAARVFQSKPGRRQRRHRTVARAKRVASLARSLASESLTLSSRHRHASARIHLTAEKTNLQPQHTVTVSI